MREKLKSCVCGTEARWSQSSLESWRVFWSRHHGEGHGPKGGKRVVQGVHVHLRAGESFADGFARSLAASSEVQAFLANQAPQP